MISFDIFKQQIPYRLEQKPPFDAPIELRIYSSEMAQLRAIGDDLRVELSQFEAVTHTRASLTEATTTKLIISPCDRSRIE